MKRRRNIDYPSQPLSPAAILLKMHSNLEMAEKLADSVEESILTDAAEATTDALTVELEHSEKLVADRIRQNLTDTIPARLKVVNQPIFNYLFDPQWRVDIWTRKTHIDADITLPLGAFQESPKTQEHEDEFYAFIDGVYTPTVAAAVDDVVLSVKSVIEEVTKGRVKYLGSDAGEDSELFVNVLNLAFRIYG